MIEPSVRKCDLCKEVIPPGRPYCALHYPLSRDDREKLTKAMQEQLGRMPGTILHLMPVAAMIPGAYAFELCVGCVDGFLPDLAGMKSDYIRNMINRQREKAEEENAVND